MLVRWQFANDKDFVPMGYQMLCYVAERLTSAAVNAQPEHGACVPGMRALLVGNIVVVGGEVRSMYLY